MKKLISLILLGFTFLFVSCKKKDDDNGTSNKEAVIIATVKDQLGRTYENFTVYAINEDSYSSFGLNTFHKDKSEISDANGKVKFKFSKTDLLLKDERNFYFFVEYSKSGQNYAAHKGIKVELGETKEISIVMD